MMLKSTAAAFAFVVMSAAAWALPTTQDVEAAVRQGNYSEAETMMSEVVAAKPDSAKAHYLYAEMLSHNRNFAKAAEEAGRARQLDPAIKFTTADKFSAFEQLLQRERTAETRPQTRVAPSALTPRPVQATPSSPAIPGWMWAAALALIAFVLWRGFNRSRNAAPAASGASWAGAAPAAGAPFSPGTTPGMATYGPGVPPATPGSGMLGTGLAVAGGVAGGMLLGEMLHNHQGGASTGGTPLDRVMPGAAPSIGNDAANELEDRPVDFGNGGDWDTGGSADLGGGGDGGGGGWD